MEAYGKNILLEIEQAENTTKSGIVLAQETTRSYKGVIVSKGQEVSDLLQIGAKVMFRKYADGKGFDIDDKHYAVVHEDDILLHG
jgi:co-chaperonin GroES (HSP10)